MSLKDLFRAEAVEHRRQRLHGEVLLTLPVTHWAITALIALVLAALLAALFFVSYARRQTVTGWIRPDQGVVQVFAEQSAVVETLLVREGDAVVAGQPLATLRSGGALADGTPAAPLQLAALERGREQLTAQLGLVRSQAALKTERLKGEIDALVNEQAQLRGQLDGQRKRVAIAQELLEQRLTLVRQGFISAAETRAAEERKLELAQEAAELEHRLLVKRQEERSRRHDLEAQPLERDAGAAVLGERLAALEQRIAELRQRKHLAIAAPVAGKVGSLRIRRGETVTDKLALLDIVPVGATLQAELFAPSQAIGLLRPGAPVRLRLDSYPYEKFGAAEGRVLHIAPTSSMPAELPQGPGKSGPVFRVVVELARDRIELGAAAYPLQPGMTLTADVLLEKRRLVEYLFAPLLGALPSQ